MNKTSIFYCSSIAAALLLGGCASTEPADIQQLKSQLQAEQTQRGELESTLASLKSKQEMQSMELQKKEQMLASFESKGGDSTALLPPNAKAGECYARVFIPPTYENVTKTVVAREASNRLVTSEPVYEWVQERVLVREASKRLEVVPARYDMVEERVMTREASEELVVQPAVYRDEEERLLVRDAYTTWKKGRGPIERVDQATGEIMCLVEVPAEYKTVVKKVLVSAASTQAVPVPAQYKTLKKRVMVEPPRTVEVEIPAEYKTVRVRKLVSKGTTQTVEVPETYQNVTQTRLASEGRMEWKSILCETNTTADVIRKLQSALLNEGYPPGRLDGVLGSQTMSAVSRYQGAEGLARGKLTMETLRKLGVI